jgi:transcriptional regulator GlxA family with amidase domain
MFRVEFIDTADALQGPSAAMRDALAMAAAVARATGRTWEAQCKVWRAGEDPAAPVPEVAVFGGWRADGGPHLSELIRRDAALQARLRAVHAGGGHVVALYNGVAALAHAGLLTGRRCVIPWPFLGVLLGAEPSLHLAQHEPWAEDERVWTVAAPSTAGAVALELAARFGLGPFAQGVREVLELSADRQELVANFASRLRPRPVKAVMERASRWIDEHLHEPFEMAALASELAMSERTLLRKFRQEHGMTPVQMLHRRRVVALRMLLETTPHPVARVAELCGWKSAAMMRKVFKQETGMTPDAWRRTYSVMPQRTGVMPAGAAPEPAGVEHGRGR